MFTNGAPAAHQVLAKHSSC